jgi:hypothetical protein
MGCDVRDAVRSALPTRRKKTERPHLKIAPAAAFIDEVLAADRKAPRKQRHTAKRIWERIRLEVPGCTAAERTVRQYVEGRKQELGFGRRETFVPQSYDFGVEVQIDWYEAYAEMDGFRGSGQSCRCSRCVRWPAARPSIAHICGPHSRRFSKLSNPPG